LEVLADMGVTAVVAVVRLGLVAAMVARVEAVAVSEG